VKWFAAVLLTLALTAHAETITGLVVGVADGDTITVLDADKVQHKIRLAGIDAPDKKQAFG
jgi:endonuclease YncB( thermonuclease family)